MLEIIATTPDDARAAEEGGAGRIELVSALSQGGLTPGFGLMQKTIAAVKIPVNVMIRPHARNFCYSDSDVAVMLAEIEAARQAGAHGVVFGALTESGEVDEDRLERLLAASTGMEVTFHRAIDASQDPVQVAQVLSRHATIRTILTSGGDGPIEAHTGILRWMQAEAQPLQIMAGGGITLANVASVVKETGLRDIHVGTAVRRDASPHGEVIRALVKDLADLLDGCGVDRLR